MRRFSPKLWAKRDRIPGKTLLPLPEDWSVHEDSLIKDPRVAFQMAQFLRLPKDKSDYIDGASRVEVADRLLANEVQDFQLRLRLVENIVKDAETIKVWKCRAIASHKAYKDSKAKAETLAGTVATLEAGKESAEKEVEGLLSQVADLEMKLRELMSQSSKDREKARDERVSVEKFFLTKVHEDEVLKIQRDFKAEISDLRKKHQEAMSNAIEAFKESKEYEDEVGGYLLVEALGAVVQEVRGGGHEQATRLLA